MESISYRYQGNTVVGRLERFSAAAAFFTASVGFLVLAGWLFDSMMLKSFMPDWPAMKPLSALGIWLAGVALGLLRKRTRSAWRIPLGRLCAAVTVAIGLTVLSEWALGTRPGIDSLLFEAAVNAETDPYPGRPALSTVFCLVLSGMALLSLDCSRCGWLPSLTLSSLLAGLLGVFGHLYGASALYSMAHSPTLAPHTAISVVILNLGILAARPAHPFIAVLSSNRAGGDMARRMLPIIVSLPAIISWFELTGEHKGWFGPEFGAALTVNLDIVLFGVFVYWTAYLLNRADSKTLHNLNAARESEKLLRLAWLATRDVIWDCDISHYTQRWSDSAIEVFGWREVVESPQPIQWWFDRVHSEERERVKAGFLAALYDPACERWQDEYRFQKADDSYADVFDRGYVLRDARGKPLRMIGAMQDISERKRAETALSEHRARLARELEETQRLQTFSSQLIKDEFGENLYDQVVEAAMAIMKADFGSFQIFDTERGELQLIAWRNFHPASAEHWRHTSSYSGTICGSALQHGERIIIPSVDNESVPIDDETRRHYRLSGIAALQSTPLTTRKGRLIGMISTHWRQPHLPRDRDFVFLDLLARQAADILERRRALEALRDSEDRLRFALETSHIGAWDMDLADHRAYRSFEHARIFGYDQLSPAWTYETFLAHVLPEDRESVEATLQQSKATQGDFSYECRIRRVDGEVRWIWVAGRHRTDAGGRRRLVGIVQDITQRKEGEEALQRINDALEKRVQERTCALQRNEEQLRRSLHQKEVLLKEIHHRVKNNLQIITSLLKMQADTQTDMALRDQFHDCQHRIRSMALIHEQLYRSQDLKSIDFADYAAQLVGHVHRSFAHSVTRVAVRLAIPPLLIDIDKALPLGLILNELVSNSFKHAFSEPFREAENALWVTVEPKADDGVLLEVGDSGSGLPDEFDLDRLPSMGLMLIRSLVMQLQGRLSVQRQPNTAFRIVLPREMLSSD